MASKNTKKAQIQQTKNTAALATASGIDLTKSLGALAASSVSIQSTIASIQEELVQKHAQLKAVDDAIALKKQEMETLHGADQILLAIDELRENQKNELDRLAKERAHIEQQNFELTQQLAQQRQRDEAEYKYNLDQKRKQEQDQYLDTLRTRQNTERDRIEKFEKESAAREEALKAKETQYQDAIAKAATFDADVKKETDKAVAIVTNSMKKDHEHQNQLAKVQHESEVSKLKHDNERLIQAHNNVETQLKEVQAQLKEAYAKNNELAAKAVEAANNKQAQADALALVTNIGSGNGTRART